MVVLVVEDGTLVNLVTSEELGHAGYDVISAFNADQAIDILGTRDDIDIVFTDIEMPGSRDGLKLAAAVRDRWPPIHIIITSGKPPQDLLPPRVAFVAKPYRLARVRAIIEAF